MTYSKSGNIGICDVVKGFAYAFHDQIIRLLGHGKVELDASGSKDCGKSFFTSKVKG